MKISDVPSDELRRIVAAVKNKTHLERQLFGSSRQHRRAALLERISAENIDITHWTGRHIRKAPREKKDLADLSPKAIRRRIIENNIIKYECAECGSQPIWQNKPLTLHLDHVDGNDSNNSCDNLRFLCPNCHQQTETWGNKRCRKLFATDDELLLMAKTKTYTDMAKEFGVNISTISCRLRKYYE
jgi:predicted RNA-binding Zn-ribbon protein involved in translation (DUF1610 family)